MIRILRMGSSATVHINASDTERFATRPGSAWPASAVRGHTVTLYLDTRTGDLVDYIGPADVLADELDALQDYAAERADAPDLAKTR